MNTKLFKLLTAGTFVAMLSACGDTVIEYSDDPVQVLPSSSDRSGDPVQTKTTLNVVVKDAITGVPLSALVKLLSTGETTTTSEETGTSSFKNVSAGYLHTVLIEKDGYTSFIYTADIGEVGQVSENIFIAGENTAIVNLYPETSSLDGYVYYVDIDGVNKVAAGAKVRIELKTPTTGYCAFNICDFVEKVFSATTDANGKFYFPKLPAVGNNYDFYILETTKDGHTYQTASRGSVAELLKDSPAHATNVIKYYISDLVATFELMDYKTTIGSTDILSLEFSDSIDTQKFNPDMISVIPSIPVDKKVEGKILKLVPLDKWPSKFTVNFSDLKSVRGISFNSHTIPINVESVSIAEAIVQNFMQADTSDWNDLSVKLKWDKLANATGYKIYAKAREGAKKGEFVQLANILSSSDTNITITVSGNCDYTNSNTYPFTCFGTVCENLFGEFNYSSNSCLFTKGGSLEFLVQAYNTSSETNLKTALTKTVTVKDTKKPSVNPESVVTTGSISDNNLAPTGLVRFGYTNNSWSKNSYIYALHFGPTIPGNYGHTTFWNSGEYGLDPTEFGFYSDLAYYLSLPGASTTTNGIAQGCTKFTEPMDTTAALVVAKSGLSNRVSVDTKWSSNSQELCFTFKVTSYDDDPPFAPPTTMINATYSISGLKDKNGNTFEVEHLAPTGNKATLDFGIASIPYVNPTP